MTAKLTLEPIPRAVHEFLELLSRPWTMHILWVLTTDGPSRFGVLGRRIEKISSRVLSQRLRVLERNGLIYRDYQPSVPPAVTYGITERMKGMENILNGLDAMAAKWREENPISDHDAAQAQGRQNSPSAPGSV